jgi:hypothetical protein
MQFFMHVILVDLQRGEASVFLDFRAAAAAAVPSWCCSPESFCYTQPML